MKQGIFTIEENEALKPYLYRMRLKGDVSDIMSPGQFINISLNGFYLRRPISVFDKDEESVSIIFKTVGAGTDRLSRMRSGDMLDVLTGLGNGYDISGCGDKPLLIGGGVGIPPLYYLAKNLAGKAENITVVMGFNKSDEIFLKDEFERLGCRVIITTVDGSLGTKGFVTDALPEEYSYFYTCGPEPMLKAVFKSVVSDGEFSFEERMGCGFGACMGCSCKTVTGYKRICKDGPVLKKGEILW